jgi:hypothetical protein
MLANKINKLGPQPDQSIIHYKGLKKCHEWTKAKSKEGYGKHTVNYKTVAAHRYIWEQVNGPIPKGKLVLHKCDNRCCVNPDHLFLGSQKDNCQDCMIKGRMNQQKGDNHYSKRTPEKLARGDRHKSRTQPNSVAKHENHGHSKLTMAKANEIRELYSSGVYTQRELAKKYNVSHGTIFPILKYKTWIHI